MTVWRGEAEKELSDEELMLRVKEGDERCLQFLMERYQRPLFNFIYKMMGDPSSAEDLFQESFLRIYRHASRYSPRAKFQTYLFTVARRLCLNELKKRSYRRHLSLDQPIGGDGPGARLLHSEVASDGPSAMEMLEEDQRRLLVQQALMDLDPKHRIVILLAEFEGLPYQQIARIIGSSVGTVKSRVFRGKQKIREWLERHEMFKNP